jgi:hypothetical protein
VRWCALRADTSMGLAAAGGIGFLSNLGRLWPMTRHDQSIELNEAGQQLGGFLDSVWGLLLTERRGNGRQLSLAGSAC